MEINNVATINSANANMTKNSFIISAATIIVSCIKFGDKFIIFIQKRLVAIFKNPEMTNDNPIQKKY